MLTEGAPVGTAVHATAVAIDGRALAIIGASRSGKSATAAALLSRSTTRRRIELIGDDRVLLVRRSAGDIVVRPHPRIAGFMERRGLGIVSARHRSEAPLVGLADLGQSAARRIFLPNLPTLALEDIGDVEQRLDLVFEWWASITQRQTEHRLPGKRR